MPGPTQASRTMPGPRRPTPTWSTPKSPWLRPSRASTRPPGTTPPRRHANENEAPPDRRLRASVLDRDSPPPLFGRPPALPSADLAVLSSSGGPLRKSPGAWRTPITSHLALPSSHFPTRLDHDRADWGAGRDRAVDRDPAASDRPQGGPVDLDQGNDGPEFTGRFVDPIDSADQDGAVGVEPGRGHRRPDDAAGEHGGDQLEAKRPRPACRPGPEHQRGGGALHPDQQ